jgi:hypothetical protein
MGYIDGFVYICAQQNCWKFLPDENRWDTQVTISDLLPCTQNKKNVYGLHRYGNKKSMTLKQSTLGISTILI